MFRCHFCGCVVARRTPACRVLLETRPKSYPRRPAANRPVPRWVKGGLRKVRPDDPGGTGREIAREVLACATCAARPPG